MDKKLKRVKIIVPRPFSGKIKGEIIKILTNKVKGEITKDMFGGVYKILE